MVTTQKLYSECSETVLSSLFLIASSQNEDGGWGYRPGEPTTAGATAHVLTPFADLGFFRAGWIERGYCRLESLAGRWEGFPQWSIPGPFDAEPRTGKDWGDTLKSCYVLLTVLHRGRPLSQLSEAGLCSAVTKGVHAFLNHHETWVRESSWWYLQMAGMALRSANPASPLWRDVLRVIESTDLDPDVIANTGEGDRFKETAHICSAILAIPEAIRPDCSHLIDFLVENMVQDERGGYWPCTLSEARLRGPFFATRWVLWALERFYAAMPGNDRVKGTIERGIRWLVSTQQPDGNWLDPTDRPYLNTFPGYAVLVIERALEQGAVPAPSRHREFIERRLLTMGKAIHYCSRTGSRCSQAIQQNRKFLFVIMPFGDKFKNVYNLAIQPAAADAGLLAEKADKHIDSKEIWCSHICKPIQEAMVVVADISERNPNVYLELGLCYGCEKDVLLISKSDEPIPFDISPVQVIKYDPNDLLPLKRKLSDAFRARSATNE